MSHREGNGFIVGTIRDAQGIPVAGALVHVFAVRLRDEETNVGKVATDADGRYRIAVGDGSTRPGVRVAVCDAAGRELVSSPVRFAVEAAAAIDLTLPNASNGVSEFERYTAALEPVLHGVALATANATDSAFLAGATGIPAADLRGLIDASARAGEEPTSLPAEVFYGWHRQGLPLGQAELQQHPTDELLGALRAAADAGVVPARIGDDLEGIGARIDERRAGNAGVRAEVDAPEEIRALPDVTIRVRQTGPGSFEATFTPIDPLHIARNGYTLDTRRGLRGHTVAEVLDRAEANWQQNYPRATPEDES